VIGVTRMPPSAPSAADMAKLMNSTQLVLMPTSSAATRLNEVASMALPCSVRLKKYHSAITTTAVTPSTHRLCGISVAPENFDRCVTGERRQAVRALAQPDLDQTANHQRGTNGDDDQGDRFGAFDRLDRQLFDQHTHDGRHHNRQHQRHRQRQPAWVKNTASMPPSMMNSPWAKLITLLAL
jgi:hypothetical protein